jgi:hypothetical protein
LFLSPVDVATSSRGWLTCEDPEQPVKKYTEYAHGDSKGERRIVLDQHILPKAGNLRVSRADLLEPFLSTLEEQARLASDLGEHILGDVNTYG